MRYGGFDEFRRTSAAGLTKGPVALIFAEDPVEVAGTIRHHRACGFPTILLFASPEMDLDLPAAVEDAADVHRIDADLHPRGSVTSLVNRAIRAAPGQWMFYCFNAEYLYYPFAETRSIREMLAFHTEERRDAMLTYVIDLYAADLEAHPDAVSIADAHLDRSGYYALARPDPARNGAPRERQLDFHGGLRWRFEEHVPPDRRKIDRIALFRAMPGLHLRDDHTFDDEEYNTYACPWHNNITAVLASFRTAKALKANAGSTFDIPTFHWHNSTRFEWSSQQLMDHGLMEPGQWF